MSNTIVEAGEIYFFYRPKIDVDRVAGVDDIQRLYFLLWPSNQDQGRLFIVGRKQLPEITDGNADPKQRDWVLLDMTGSPEALADALRPVSYDTKTEGRRIQPQAVPSGAGRYAIFERNGASRIGYRLVLPKKLGPAQQALGIRQEASCVLSVRSPRVNVPGFPDSDPGYPNALEKKFADKRFIDIDDARFLDYPGAQFVMIGAHDTLDQADVDIAGSAGPLEADVFDRLKLDREEWQSEALNSGEFAQPAALAQPVEPSSDPSKGGKRGGQQAVNTASAAGVASALKDIAFPVQVPQLVKHAEKKGAPSAVIDVLEELPQRQFENMADVQRALGEVR